MKPLRDKFEELAELLITNRDNLSQGTGVPFVRLLYHPDEEIEARDLTRLLQQKLEKAGYQPEKLWNLWCSAADGPKFANTMRSMVKELKLLE